MTEPSPTAGSEEEPQENIDTGEGSALIDPVDAIFSGLESSFLRGLLVCFAALLAFLLHYMAYSGEMTVLVFPFACTFSVFLWAGQGVWFFAGFGALLAALYFGYRFTLDEGGKEMWFALVLCFGFYFLPINFTRTSGFYFGDIEIARDWIGSIVIFAAFSTIFWLAPTWIQRGIATIKARRKAVLGSE